MTLLARDVVLKCYYVPATLRQYADRETPLPKGLERVLQNVVQTWQPQHSIDDAPEYELHRALLYFVKHACFLDDGDHYRTLMTSVDAPQERIEQHYRWLVTLLQSDTQESILNISRYMVRISRAVAIVGDPGQRRVYNRTLFGPLAAECVDINVNDIAEGVLGVTQPDVRVRQCIEVDYTVEHPNEPVTPAAQCSDAKRDPRAKQEQKTRPRNEVTRSRTGMVVTALSIPAALFWSTVGNQDQSPLPPPVLKGFVHPSQYAGTPAELAALPEGGAAARRFVDVSGIAKMPDSIVSASTVKGADSPIAWRDSVSRVADESPPAHMLASAAHAEGFLLTPARRDPISSHPSVAALETSELAP